MKKNLFLLGSFMASSLVGANTLLVIGCQKKASVKEKKNDEKNTQQVELELAVQIKNEIRNIIDDVIANPVGGLIDWIIDLKGKFSNDSKSIIDFLNDKVKELIEGKIGQDGEVAFESLTDLDSNLKDKVRGKFANLKDLIIKRINEKKQQLGVSNFSLVLEQANIEPILTTLNGIQVMEAIAKLKLIEKPVGYADLDANKNDNEEIDKIKIDLFKVKANLTYSFSFNGIKPQQDSYNDAELLLTGDTKNHKKIKLYTQKTIRDILIDSDEVKDVVIYSSNDNSQNYPVTAKEIQEYDYIGKQMDWDFSKRVVNNEIAAMQYNNLNKIKAEKSTSKIKDIVKEMGFKAENFYFETDSSRYMKFDNYDMDLKRNSEDCIFMCGDLTSPGNENLFGNESSKAITKITEQFFSDNDSDSTKWTGGKINHKFIEQVKKDSDNSEGKTPRIDLSKFYWLDSDNRVKNMLIGYGETTIRKVSYAGISLSPLVINTNLVSPYTPTGMEDLYTDFRNYVETIISAIRNEKAIGEGKNKGLKLLKNDPSTAHFWQWRFGNEGEWAAIQEELTKQGNGGSVTFDWIMENILLKKRILGNPDKYNLPVKNGVLDTAKTFLKSKNEIKYVQSEEPNKFLIAKGYSKVSAIMYVKYGPFTAYLNYNDSRPIWRDDNETGITPQW